MNHFKQIQRMISTGAYSNDEIMEKVNEYNAAILAKVSEQEQEIAAFMKQAESLP